MTARFAVFTFALGLSVAFTATLSAQSPEQRFSDSQLAAPKLVTEPPATLDLKGTPLKEIVAAIEKATGVTVRYHSGVTNLDAVATVKLSNSLPADAFQTVLGSRSLAFKVTSAKTVFVYPDT